jgi:hypothetical protein
MLLMLFSQFRPIKLLARNDMKRATRWMIEPQHAGRPLAGNKIACMMRSAEEEVTGQQQVDYTSCATNWHRHSRSSSAAGTGRRHDSPASVTRHALLRAVGSSQIIVSSTCTSYYCSEHGRFHREPIVYNVKNPLQRDKDTKET